MANLLNADIYQSELRRAPKNVRVEWDGDSVGAYAGPSYLGPLNLKNLDANELALVEGLESARLEVLPSQFNDGVYGRVIFPVMEDLGMPNAAPSVSYPHLGIAYLVWFLTGILGGHHYYLKRWGWGIAYTLTAGLFGIGWIVDAFRLPRLVNG